MRCYSHETVMFPPPDCLDCIKATYGPESDEYRAAKNKHSHPQEDHR